MWPVNVTRDGVSSDPPPHVDSNKGEQVNDVILIRMTYVRQVTNGAIFVTYEKLIATI